ncbi:MAG: penicillin-binding protein 2 [Spirochaetia bacterium]|nr:penicillin-binding protein 2 [Spirochaetia bacterium]
MIFAANESSSQNDTGNARLVFIVIFIFVTFVLLLMRLFVLQIESGDKYLEKSQRVIRKVVTFSAPRGEMFERYFKNRENAKNIVSNSTNLVLVAIPTDFEKEKLLEKTALLEKALNLPANSLTSKIPLDKLNSNEEIILIDKLTPQEMTILADYHFMFMDFIIKQNTTRWYNFANAVSHVTGYIGLPSPQDIKAGFKSNQWVGKNGLEKQYDDILKGEDGEIVQIKTATGDMEEQKVFKNFIPGNNLVLTLDMELQNLAWASLGDKRGAIVVIKPSTGEILVMASKPDYDPNILISNNNDLRNQHLEYIKNQFAEINRSITTKYPPASTFKPLVALAAMEEKQVSMSETFFCPGSFTIKSSYQNLPDSTFHCWAAHGENNIVTALANSCSVYFYKLGQKIGAQPIIRYSKYFMLDQTTGIDLPGEIAGFIPTPEWKEKQFRQRWFDGDTVNLSIGQGFVETTLISMVDFFSAIATGGVVYKPHLVKQVLYAENDEVKEDIKRSVLYELPISTTTLNTIQAGLRQVVISGTASGLFNRDYLMPIAGKTGTVQTRSERFQNKTQHAWFIGYGPYQGDIEKSIVVGVIVEYGVTGSAGAAPVAFDIFNTWSRRLKTGNKLD